MTFGSRTKGARGPESRLPGQWQKRNERTLKVSQIWVWGEGCGWLHDRLEAGLLQNGGETDTEMIQP